MVTINRYEGIIKKLRGQASNNYSIDEYGNPIPQEQQPVQDTRAPIGYGVFAQGLAGALQAQAADPAYGGGATHALANYAERERANVATATAADQKYKLFQTLIEHPELAKDPRAVQHLATDYGLFNPVTVGADAAIDRAGAQAGTHKTEAEATETLYKAGVKPNIDDVNATQGNAITGTPAEYGVFQGGVSNNDQAAQTNAAASMKKADADMIDSTNPNKYNRKSGGSGSSGEEGSYSYIVPMTIDGQTVAVTRKGKGAPPTGNSGTSSNSNPVRQQAQISKATSNGFTVLGHNKHGDPVVEKNGQRLAIGKDGRAYK